MESNPFKNDGGDHLKQNGIVKMGSISSSAESDVDESATEDSDAVKAYSSTSVRAERGYATPQYNLGRMFEEGRGVKQDYTEAANWYRKAAEQGHGLAQGRLGYLYLIGKGVARDYSEALKWCIEGAAKGDSFAQNNLGWMYFNGKGVERNYSTGIVWFYKAAVGGLFAAQFNLAIAYAQGKGVKMCHREARLWYRRAAKQRSAPEQCRYGMMCEIGRADLKAYEDCLKEERLCRIAVEQRDVVSEYRLGIIYLNGTGAEQDYSKGIMWLRRSAERGYPNAQYELGIAYAEGKGVQKDQAEANMWLEKSAKYGYPPAQKYLESLHQSRQSRKANPADRLNYAEIARHCRRAASIGYAPAQYNLGAIYANGEGVAQSYSVALRLFKQAAEKGYSPAFFGIGFIYSGGEEGPPYDLVKAWMWLSLALEQGHPSAKHYLEKLASMITPAQIVEAQRLVKWWKRWHPHESTRHSPAGYCLR
jgi:uncharacterized protein